MTRDDINRIAMLASIKVRGYYDESGSTPQELERFANLVAAAEREACAVIAHNTYEGFGVDAQGVDFVKQQIIRQIKARGQV